MKHTINNTSGDNLNISLDRWFKRITRHRPLTVLQFVVKFGVNPTQPRHFYVNVNVPASRIYSLGRHGNTSWARLYMHLIYSGHYTLKDTFHKDALS